MPAAAEVGLLIAVVSLGGGTGSLANCLREGHQVVVGRRGRAELAVVADQIPAARGREPAGVGLAEVV